MQPTAILAGILLHAGRSIAQVQHPLITSNSDLHEPDMYNVAIIGAGAAGSSAAFYLSQYAVDTGMPVNITIFERESYFGGRSTTVNAYNDSRLPIELGASIFVKVNHILVEATERFNLSTSSFGATRAARPDAPSLGIWDGQQFVVKLASSGPTWWDAGKLLFRYGWSPIRTMQLMKSTVGDFLKMYDFPYFPFASLTDVAEELGLAQVTATTGIDYLTGRHISEQYAHDVIQASTRVNYAQNLHNFHALETMVCMATDGAMAITGGNWQIFDHMIDSANATILLSSSVAAVKQNGDGYQVMTSGASEAVSTKFDAVILAGPYQYSGIELPDSSTVPPKINYVKLHVTLFTSPHHLRPTFFGLAEGEPVPRTVLTTTRCRGEQMACFGDHDFMPDFYSISLLTRVVNPVNGRHEYAYKIFSKEAPSADWLLGILDVDSPSDGITWLYRKVWHSYPKEVPVSTFADITLDRGIYYTGGMESFISTMETNALMGRNVARLLIDDWLRSRQHSVVRQDHIDL